MNPAAVKHRIRHRDRYEGKHGGCVYDPFVVPCDNIGHLTDLVRFHGTVGYPNYEIGHDAGPPLRKTPDPARCGVSNWDHVL